MGNITIRDVPLKRLDELAEIMAMSREDMLNILIDDAWCETMAGEDETDHSNCRHEFLVLDHEKGRYFCSDCGVYIPLDLDDVPY